MSKVDIISGFLGAGKTTLIRKILPELKDEKVVLIENEFGDVGIDGAFLEEAGIEIKEMNSGCICCSLVGDFREALLKVVEEYHPDRLMIEPSGVGKLSDVIEAVEAVDLKLNGLVCVVDVNKAKMYHKNFGEFFDNQITSATIIILSRTKNVSAEKAEEVVHMLKEMNEKAHFIVTDWDELTARQIIDVIDKVEDETLHVHQEECSCGHVHHEHHHDKEHCCCHEHEHDHECCHEEHEHHHEDECCCHEHHHDHAGECCCGHHHDHEEHECECGHHGHHHHHADEMFTSQAFETAHVYSVDELKEMLEGLDETILRCKGMVQGVEGWLFFDYVPGEIDIREGSVQTIGKIVVIGTQVDVQKMAQHFAI